MDFDLRGLLRRVVEEVEAEIRQVERVYRLSDGGD